MSGGRDGNWDDDGWEVEADEIDLPETHLDDDDYEDFLQREFGADGSPRGRPPVGLIIAVVIVALLAWLVVQLQ